MKNEGKTFISNGVKKILVASLFIFCFGFASHAIAAQNFVPLAGIPGLTQNVAITSGGLAGFFNSLYKYLIGLAAVIAVIVIIYEGIRIATNQDSVSVLTDGKGRIWQAILGLVLVLSPVVVFSIINPSILNLSLNLPPIDLTTKRQDPAGGTPAQVSTPTMNKGLTVLSVAYYGQKNAVGDINDKTKTVVPAAVSQLQEFQTQCTTQGKTVAAPTFNASVPCYSGYKITDTSSGIVCAVYNINCQ